jgi:hypothetical protein
VISATQEAICRRIMIKASPDKQLKTLAEKISKTNKPKRLRAQL